MRKPEPKVGMVVKWAKLNPSHPHAQFAELSLRKKYGTAEMEVASVFPSQNGPIVYLKRNGLLLDIPKTNWYHHDGRPGALLVHWDYLRVVSKAVK